MKVLYLIPGLGAGGGAERSLASMAPVLAERVDLHIVTFSERAGLVADLEAAGARCSTLPAPGRKAQWRGLDALLRAERPDLVHTTLFDADLLGRLAGVARRTPVSSSLVNVNYGPDQRGVPGLSPVRLRAAQVADAASARVVVRFHALTEHVADVMARRLVVRRSRIEVIPRGRDASLLGLRTEASRAAARAAHGLGDELLVLAAARHEWQKGLDLLVAAAPSILDSHPGAAIWIGGRHGTQTDRLESLAAELGVADRIRFIGPRDDLAALMCAADVFCVPSRWEGFGSILVEAMAIGVPTVASDVGSITEVAGPERWASLFRRGDASGLAAAVLDVAANTDRAADRVLAGQDRFRRCYTADVVAEQLVSFFDRAAGASRWRP